jgi:hypothetical protein
LNPASVASDRVHEPEQANCQKQADRSRRDKVPSSPLRASGSRDYGSANDQRGQEDDHLDSRHAPSLVAALGDGRQARQDCAQRRNCTVSIDLVSRLVVHGANTLVLAPGAARHTSRRRKPSRGRPRGRGRRPSRTGFRRRVGKGPPGRIRRRSSVLDGTAERPSPDSTRRSARVR